MASGSGYNTEISWGGWGWGVDTGIQMRAVVVRPVVVCESESSTEPLDRVRGGHGDFCLELFDSGFSKTKLL